MNVTYALNKMIKIRLKMIFKMYRLIIMVLYICDVCKKEFKQKSHLDNHKKRKFPCEKFEEAIQLKNPLDHLKNHNLIKATEDLEENQCEFCLKKFSTSSNCKRHQKTCVEKQKQQYASEEERSNREMIKALQQKIELMMEKIGTGNNSMINNNTLNMNNCNNTQNITFKLNPYGEENLDRLLAKKSMFPIMRNFNFASVTKLIDDIHFNDRLPENMNIYIPNIKNGYVAVYNGEDWNLMNQDEFIRKLIEDKYYILEDFYNSNVEELDKLKYKDSMAYERFIDFLDRLDEPEYGDRMKEDAKLLLYNKKHMALHTKAQLKKNLLA